MMPMQALTVGQLTHVRPDGAVDFIAHDGLIKPERYEFANREALIDYLVQVVGGRREGEGVRGAVSRTGTYSRRAPDGAQAITFGDPVLDGISSADGRIVLAGQTIDLQAAGGPLLGSNGGPAGVVFSAPDLKYKGIVNGAERWATDDNSLVEYRIGTGRMTFHAWKKSTIYKYWSMGGEISVLDTATHFEAADIWAVSYMTVPGKPACAVYNPGHSSATDDKYLDQYDWGWNSQQPQRVAVLCRAQWHHARFTDVLTAGEGCLNYLNETWPLGYPPEWDTIPTIIDLNGNWTDGSNRSAVLAVKFKSFKVDMSAYNRPAANGSIIDGSTVRVTFPDDASYTGILHPPNTIRWSNGSAWTKIVNTLIDLNGTWTDGTRRAIILEGPQSLSVDMSDFDRPAAHGSIVNVNTIEVKFPDDATYTGTIQPPNTIKWSNGSAWKRM